jgi:hypothetical protein
VLLPAKAMAMATRIALHEFRLVTRELLERQRGREQMSLELFAVEKS